MATLSQDDIKALEQTRQRLLPLHQSLTALQQSIAEQQPLPSWSALQSHSALIDGNLKEIALQLAKHQTLLASMVVFPLPQFPGRTQEHILQQMLRTKLEPNVEDWVERGQEVAQTASKSSLPGLSDTDLDQLWEDAPPVASEKGRKQQWGNDYTLAEVEMGVQNVRTGLKRELVLPPTNEDEGALDDDDEEEDYDEEDDADEDDDDKMDVVEVRRKSGAPGLEYGVSTKTAVTQMPLENTFRFMMTGMSGPTVP